MYSLCTKCRGKKGKWVRYGLAQWVPEQAWGMKSELSKFIFNVEHRRKSYIIAWTLYQDHLNYIQHWHFSKLRNWFCYACQLPFISDKSMIKYEGPRSGSLIWNIHHNPHFDPKKETCKENFLQQLQYFPQFLFSIILCSENLLWVWVLYSQGLLRQVLTITIANHTRLLVLPLCPKLAAEGIDYVILSSIYCMIYWLVWLFWLTGLAGLICCVIRLIFGLVLCILTWWLLDLTSHNICQSIIQILWSIGQYDKYRQLYC